MTTTTLNPLECAGEILTALPGGVLLTSAADGQDNTMTIGWGFLGVDWAESVFVALIRTGRYTRELLDKNPYFTVNVPGPDSPRRVLGQAGSTTGRGTNKIDALGLTRVPSEKIDVPSIKEFPLTLECEIIYRQEQNPEDLPEDIRTRMYPQDVDSSATGANRDAHVAYYGKIVNCRRIEN